MFCKVLRAVDDGTRREIGQVVDFADHIAEELLAIGAVEKVDAPAPGASVVDRLVVLFRDQAPATPPAVKTLGEQLGEKVTAADRDAAWATWQAELEAASKG